MLPLPFGGKKDRMTALVMFFTSVPYARLLFIGFSPRKSGFDPKVIQVGYMVDRITLVRVCLERLIIYDAIRHPISDTHHLSSGAGTSGPFKGNGTKKLVPYRRHRRYGARKQRLANLHINLQRFRFPEGTSYPQGAEHLMENCQLYSCSQTSDHFMEPEGSLPCSQEHISARLQTSRTVRSLLPRKILFIVSGTRFCSGLNQH
jgi:hypothetical protein